MPKGVRECVDCPRREAYLAHLEQSRTEWRKNNVQAREGVSGWMYCCVYLLKTGLDWG